MNLISLFAEKDYKDKYISTSGGIWDKNNLLHRFIVCSAKLLGCKAFDRVEVATELRKAIGCGGDRGKVSSIEGRLLGESKEETPIMEANCSATAKIFADIRKKIAVD